VALGFGRKTIPSIELCLLNVPDGIIAKLMMSFITFTQLDNMNQLKLMTRSQVSEELLKRGYTKNEYPGVWNTPDGGKAAWFIAAKRENLDFDRKSWGPEIAACKERWKNRKK
tara:strand:- start:127 stop:465 length:339 start_codon:yes stop_codon:yes gene_type:complete